MKQRESIDEVFSELATRNLFSWTFFAQGIRTEEKPFWQHEWLESLVDREESIESSNSEFSDLEGEVNNQSEVSDQKLRSIQMWQDGVVAHS